MAPDGQGRVAFLRETADLDLIFSDIELLDGKAFQIFQTVRPACPIIFCTAYDHFYVEAFQTNGIAYLLKPYDQAQFAAAWDKYRLLFPSKEDPAPSGTWFDQLHDLLQRQPRTGKKTFSVKKPEGIFLLKTEDIAFFQAQGDFVLAFDRTNRKHILQQSLQEIETLVDPHQFFRINRSEIVNFDCIVKYEPYTKNRLALTLANGGIVLHTANSRTPGFRAWLDDH